MAREDTITVIMVPFSVLILCHYRVFSGNNGRRMAFMGKMTAAQVRAQQLKALELSNQGHSADAIAERLEITPRTAARRVAAALGRIPAQQAETLRRHSETRINDWMRRVYEILDDPTTSTQDRLRAISQLATLERDRRRLLGLDVPAALVIQHEQGVIA